MDMHEFVRRLGAAEGRGPLLEALNALRHSANPILEHDTAADPQNPRGWSTWSEPGMPDPGGADRELEARKR